MNGEQRHFPFGLNENARGVSMTGDELRKARAELGRLWRLNRPVHASELARAMGWPADRNAGQVIRRHEQARSKPIPVPIACAVKMMLRGALPPDGLPARSA